MLILVLLSLCVFIFYLGINYAMFKDVDNIAGTYKKLTTLDKDFGIFFSSFYWGVSIPLMIVWINLIPNDLNVFPSIWGLAMISIGVSAMFKQDWLDNVYCISMSIGMASIFMWSFVYGNFIIAIVIILLVVVLGIHIKSSSRAYWLEVLAFINLFLQILILI